MRNGKKILAVLLAVPLMFLVGLPYAQALDVEDVVDKDLEMSYHGTLGHFTANVDDHEQGMLEKWCALPDLNIGDDSFWDPDPSKLTWSKRCGSCHIGGWFGDQPVVIGGDSWDVDPNKPDVVCLSCHVESAGDDPTIEKCMKCHKKEIEKRGLDLAKDVHMAGPINFFTCQTCHVRFSDKDSNHQLAKGTCIDTTLRTAWGTLSDLGKDCAGCHSDTPHRRRVHKGGKLDMHFNKVACETCHTGFRAGDEVTLKSRSWANGYNDDVKHGEPWLPVHKWYDGQGPPIEWPASGHLPILEPDDMINIWGAKIYPFNDVEAIWWIKDGSGDEPALDHVIPLSVVRAACISFGYPPKGEAPTEVQMRTYDGDGTPGADYPNAALWTDSVCFNVSHSVVPKEEAFNCDDCHGGSGYVLNWEALGYDGDPADHHDGMH